MPDTESVINFVPGPGIQKLDLSFDIKLLREALLQATGQMEYQGSQKHQGFGAINLTQRPDATAVTENDLSGRYWKKHSFRL